MTYSYDRRISDNRFAAVNPSSHAKKYVDTKLKSLEHGGSGWLTSDYMSDDAEWRKSRSDRENLADIQTGLMNDYMDVNEKALKAASKTLQKELKSILGANPKVQGFISNTAWMVEAGGRFLKTSQESLENLIEQGRKLASKPPPAEANVTKEQAVEASNAIIRVATAELERVTAVHKAILGATPKFLDWYKAH